MTETGMPGMLRTEQVAALARTSGAAFDRQFLEDMVQHHQGAVAMAEDVLGTGEDVRVVEMAGEVVDRAERRDRADAPGSLARR